MHTPYSTALSLGILCISTVVQALLLMGVKPVMEKLLYAEAMIMVQCNCVKSVTTRYHIG